MGEATRQKCPEGLDIWVWINNHEKCSEVKNCFQLGRVCKFISEYSQVKN